MKTKLLLLFAVVMTVFSVNAQTIAIVGEAAGGWPGDPGNPGPIDVHQMASTDGINWTLSGLTLTSASSGGGVKFRQNNDWGTNWGAATFPTGMGVLNGANILCIAGTYDVTFNSVSGEYNFSGGVPIPVVNIVGTAVTGGTIAMTATSATTFTLPTTTFLDGTAQFEIDGVLAGGTGFPMGTAVDNTSFIPVAAGSYTSVTLDLGTGDYLFTAAPIFNSIAIVGAGAGGWPTGAMGEVDVNQMSTTDGISYTLTGITLTSADIKFRENNMWTTSYGDVAWPSGMSTVGGPNIPAVAGTYDAAFNRTSLAYSFTVPTIAVVGSGAGGWPTGDAGEVDANVLSTTDGVNYSIMGVTFTDGEAKLRANNMWTSNWGGASFNDILVLNGPNIPTTAGTNDVTFNRLTGQATITPSLATTSFATSTFKVYPNPANTTWNFTSSKEAIVSIQIVDMLGKVVASSTATTVDASALTTGVYFAKVATATATETIKVVRN